MTELLDIARNNRASAMTRIGGIPCGNMLSTGSDTRFRHQPRHISAEFSGLRNRH